VHLVRADLDLDRAALLVEHHRVQRLIAVGLGAGDAVVKLHLQGPVGLVDQLKAA
jgi:hypothetical protein